MHSRSSRHATFLHSSLTEQYKYCHATFLLNLRFSVVLQQFLQLNKTQSRKNEYQNAPLYYQITWLLLCIELYAKNVTTSIMSALAGIWLPSSAAEAVSRCNGKNLITFSSSIMQNCLDTLTLQIHYKDWLLSVQKPCWPTQLCFYFAENQQLRNRQHYTLW